MAERTETVKAAVKKAAAAASRKQSYTIYDDQTVGRVQIADDVVATIVALAATEVEGVASMGGGITHEKASRAGSRALARAVKIDVLENVISIRTILNMCYGYNIPATCKKVQEKIKAAVEEMTGLEVADVGVSVADVAVETARKAPKQAKTKKKDN